VAAAGRTCSNAGEGLNCTETYANTHLKV
jgi:hypothetical protein